MSHQARIAMLGGFCPVVTVPFSREYAAMEPADFVRMLLETYHMGAAVGGFNYTFGNHGAGNMAMLRELGKAMGFGAHEIPPEVYGDAPISSTRIRQCLEQGQVADAAAMLGRHYRLEGDLQDGYGGTRLFYPAPTLVIPRPGTYTAWLALDSSRSRPCIVEIMDGNSPSACTSPRTPPLLSRCWAWISTCPWISRPLAGSCPVERRFSPKLLIFAGGLFTTPLAYGIVIKL